MIRVQDCNPFRSTFSRAESLIEDEAHASSDPMYTLVRILSEDEVHASSDPMYTLISKPLGRACSKILLHAR